MDLNSIPYILSGSVIAIIGYLLKRLQDKMDATMTETAIRQLINDKIDPIKDQQTEINEDIKHVRSQIDYLVDVVLKANLQPKD